MGNVMNSSFEVLMKKEIYEILDGDKQFMEYEFIDDHIKSAIAMPYLTGPVLCELCTKFGLPRTYSRGDSPSRWKYLEELFAHCIDQNTCSNLLICLFEKLRLSPAFKGHDAEAIKSAYDTYVKTIMGQINGVLYFDDYELVLRGDQFLVQKIGCKVEVKPSRINDVSQAYINRIYNQAREDIDKKHYDSAITKARTLLEEVFVSMIEKKNKTPSKSGNIGILFKMVKDSYNMHGDADTDKRINTLLSGLEKIVSSIAEMRNKSGDAHGLGTSRIRIDEYHARLFVNAAVSMADFLLAVEIKSQEKRRE